MSDPAYLKPGNIDFCLAHVVEECGEVLAAAGKTQRWGLSSVDPTLPKEQQETNEAWLRRELADLQEAIPRLLEALDKRTQREKVLNDLARNTQDAHQSSDSRDDQSHPEKSLP